MCLCVSVVDLPRSVNARAGFGRFFYHWPPMPLRLYNTLTRRVEPLVVRDPRRITFYSCGPTVYDYAHIGNFRAFLAADVLRRALESPLVSVTDRAGAEHAGPRSVVHVMNITDVGHMTDDAEGGEAGEDRMAVAGKRLAEAKKSGKLPAGAEINPNDPYAIAAFYARAFVEDAKGLGLKVAIEAEKDATLMPRATGAIEGMRRVIDRLLESGHAYVAGAPGERAVYFDVRTFPAYGALSGNTLDDLRQGAGGRVSEANQTQKKHPADFLLWKEDAGHIMKWESPSRAGIGPGYPGWHVECTAMSAARLAGESGAGQLAPEALAGLTVADGEPIIDLHSGGEDNIFPHHECEIAQSCCAFNASRSGPFASMWVHVRFLFVEGAKMSKSKGNFFTVRDLLAKGYSPGAIRLELIRTHYRSNANFTEQGLKDAERMLERWRRCVDGAGTHPGSDTGSGAGDEAAAAQTLTAIGQMLADDLNIAGVIGELNAHLGRTSTPGKADAELVRTVDRVLGVLELAKASQASTELGVFIGCEPDAGVVKLLEERQAAKKAKDFAKSDAIRQELAGLGYQIKDAPGGKVEVRRG